MFIAVTATQEIRTPLRDPRYQPVPAPAEPPPALPDWLMRWEGEGGRVGPAGG